MRSYIKWITKSIDQEKKMRPYLMFEHNVPNIALTDLKRFANNL